jgi:hypothetical protein
VDVLGSWKRKGQTERELRALRSEPRRDFEDALVHEVRAAAPGRSTRARVGALAAVTSVFLVALASFGGLGYAATSIRETAQVARQIVKPLQAQRPEARSTAAADQYGKQDVCHRGKTLSVDKNAVAAHTAHGDTLGPCGTLGVFAAPTIVATPADTAAVPTTGDVVLEVKGLDGTLEGGSGNQILAGSTGDDKITGGKGSQIILGGGGNDKITAGKGSQLLLGGKGDDELKAGKGHDLLDGGPGNDKIDSHNGLSDLVDGGKGNDTCIIDKAKDLVKNCEHVTRK